MSAPRGLSDAERIAWAKLASSVTPLAGKRVPTAAKAAGATKQIPAKVSSRSSATPPAKPPAKRPAMSPARPPVVASRPAVSQPPRRVRHDPGLDSHWNRRLKAGEVAPDYTLDLHGHSLDAAYDRIMSGVGQARAMGARVVLVIAGRERGAEAADRSTARGAIRAKLLDWLAASPHADAIAAVRRAHIRHGGEGALYLVLRRGG